MAPWVVITTTCDATGDGRPRALFFALLKIEFLSVLYMCYTQNNLYIYFKLLHVTYLFIMYLPIHLFILLYIYCHMFKFCTTDL